VTAVSSRDVEATFVVVSETALAGYREPPNPYRFDTGGIRGG
jgi:hypothetical protein